MYPSLAQYLSAIDYSDLWWNPNESGWGLNVVQHASRNIFAVWFTYDANASPRWFVITGGTTTVKTATVLVTAPRVLEIATV